MCIICLLFLNFINHEAFGTYVGFNNVALSLGITFNRNNGNRILECIVGCVIAAIQGNGSSLSGDFLQSIEFDVYSLCLVGRIDNFNDVFVSILVEDCTCLLYTSPSPRDCS